jgi:hypothetical protein
MYHHSIRSLKNNVSAPGTKFSKLRRKHVLYYRAKAKVSVSSKTARGRSLFPQPRREGRWTERFYLSRQWLLASTVAGKRRERRTLDSWATACLDVQQPPSSVDFYCWMWMLAVAQSPSPLFTWQRGASIYAFALLLASVHTHKTLLSFSFISLCLPLFA